MSMHIVLGFVAGWIYRSINPHPADLDSLAAIGGVAVAALAYAFLNHLIVGVVLVLLKDIRLKESEVLAVENIATDMVLLGTGFVAANLMNRNPWLILPALAPLYLVQRALSVPFLKQQVNTDF